MNADEIYTAAVVYTAEEWDEVETHLCGIVSCMNLIKILNNVGEVLLRLPANTYAYNRVAYLYNKIDDVARNKAALGVF